MRKPPKKPKNRKSVQSPQSAQVMPKELGSAGAYGRSLSDFEPLKPAEEILLETCRTGEVALISKSRPEKSTSANTIRAEFMRFLLLGGDKRAATHERGPRIYGAWIKGTLDLVNTRIMSNIHCESCVFSQSPILAKSTILGNLFLKGSTTPGIAGDGLTASGDICLCYGFESIGKIMLMGAEVRGSLIFSGGIFDGDGSHSILADGITINGNVYCDENFEAKGTVSFTRSNIEGNVEFSGAYLYTPTGHSICIDNAEIKGSLFFNKNFNSIGEVRMLGCKIEGSIECNDGIFYARFDRAFSMDGANIKGTVFLCDGFRSFGTVGLIGTHIGGSLDCTNGYFNGNGNLSIIANSLNVNGSFVFRSITPAIDKISLVSAHVSRLIDDGDSWGRALTLDCFTYDNLTNESPTNANSRIDWLNKQEISMSGLSGMTSDFRPQPWRQLQKMLREMGHIEDARQVAIAFEDRLRHAHLIGQSPAHWWRWWKGCYRVLTRGFHYSFRILTGYGYRPMRLLLWMLLVWLGCAGFYWFAALPPNDAFAPSNPLVFHNEAYKACVPGTREANAEFAKLPKDDPVAGAGNWYLCETLREEYTGFSPLAYSLDVILPLVDLQQQKDWGPMIPTPQAHPWDEFRERGIKHLTRLVLWFETLFGWVASLLLVAIVSGLTKRRED